MNSQINEIDRLNKRILYVEKQIEYLKILKSKCTPIFYTTKDIMQLLNLSKGQVQRLFNRDDFPSCDYFKSQVIEYNALYDFFISNIDEKEIYKIALRKIEEEYYEK